MIARLVTSDGSRKRKKRMSSGRSRKWKKRKRRNEKSRTRKSKLRMPKSVSRSGSREKMRYWKRGDAKFESPRFKSKRSCMIRSWKRNIKLKKRTKSG